MEKEIREFAQGKQRPRRTDLNKWPNGVCAAHPPRRGAHTLLSGCAPLPCCQLISTVSSVGPSTYCCALSLLINFVPAFTVSASVINALFFFFFKLGTKIQGKIASSL